MPALTRISLALLAIVALPDLGEATVVRQQGPKKSEIRGTVVRASDRQPVTGAKVSLDGTELALTTDTKGKFKFPKVSAGQYIIRAEVEGFPVATSTLLLAQGDRLEVEFAVGPTDAVTLPELKVDESAPARVSPIVEFNRRATTGNGRYITRDDIEQRKPTTMMDVLRGGARGAGRVPPAPSGSAGSTWRVRRAIADRHSSSMAFRRTRRCST